MNMDIRAWYAHEVQPRKLQGSPRLIMGCPIWGETYIHWFRSYGLPSILAPANRKALEMAGWQLILYVEDPVEWKTWVVHSGIETPLQFRKLPEGFLKALKKDGNLKFLLLSAIHNALIIEAGRYPDAGFHMLLPDHVFSDHFFANLLWLAYKHPAIVQTSLTSVAEQVLPRLAGYRRLDDSLSVPASHLGSIGWETMTDQWRSWSLDGNETFDQMPNTDFVFWRGDDHVRMHCAHQNLMWLSPNRCRYVTTEIGGTLDSELPRYTRNYCFTPQLDDDMAFIALSSSGPPAPIVDFAKFRKDFIANLAGNRDFEKYVRAPCFLPCEPVDGFPSADALDLKANQLLRKLEEIPS
jgi:hypothetical protein